MPSRPASPPQTDTAARDCPGPGRPKDNSKAAAILQAAQALFVEHGFSAVSMDQIAASAGVSKITVYNHYGDKEQLFVAAVYAFCKQSFPDCMLQDSVHLSLDEFLLRIARHFFDFITSEQAICGHRMLCSPKVTTSPTAQLFWQHGPLRIQQLLADLLQQRASKNGLQLDNPKLAASQFFALIKGDFYDRLVFGCLKSCEEADIEAHLQASVRLFLRL